MKFNNLKISLELLFLYAQIKVKLTHLKHYSTRCSTLSLITVFPLDLLNYLSLIIIDVYYEICINYPNNFWLDSTSFDSRFLFILQNIEKKILRHNNYELLTKSINFKNYNLFLSSANLITHEDEKLFIWFFHILSEILIHKHKSSTISVKLLSIVGVHLIVKTLLIFLLLINNQSVVNSIFLSDSKIYHPQFINFNFWWQNLNQLVLRRIYSLYPIYVIKNNVLTTNYVFLPYFNSYLLQSNLTTWFSKLLK
ncbi:hypothetical protein GuthCp023 (chloroplast) [Guillardia theta]|uniref:Uncharacterized 30.1 kDa protein n=2 Tax=Guillardia theta TaxID=55529 RepID=YCX3_GUITH|nr:hypothetical protein GuthCp023 [Guillardia theta]O78431.1 RecName: Full=Uncharacterized 30.1 kDa protein; AltName: Full=ORF252 [Guillardia theta]AAC35616.1 unknown [Guillardia theta]